MLLTTLYQFWAGSLPNYHEMSIVGVLALLANVTAAALLYIFCEKYRAIYLNKFICPLMLYIMLRSLYRPSV